VRISILTVRIGILTHDGLSPRPNARHGGLGTMKILFVVPGLDAGSAAKQLALLAPGLPRDRFEVRVCVLGGEGAFAQRLRSAGVVPEVLGWTRPLDVRSPWRLRRLVRSYLPDVIHAWHPSSLRALAFAAAGRPP